MPRNHRLCLVLVALIAAGGARAADIFNQCPDDCPAPTPIVAPERFKVVDSKDGPQCTFAPDGQIVEGCDDLFIPMAWSHSPYQTSFLAKRAVIVIHGSGSDAIRAEDAVQRSADQLGLLPHETVIFAPQLAQEDDIPVDSACLFNQCIDGVNDGGFCTDVDDCRDKEIAYYGGGWRWGWRSKTGATGYERDFRISSFEVVDQLIRQITSGRFPGLEQIVVAGHSAGGQFISRYAAFTSVPSEINVPIRFVSSAPSRVLYMDGKRWSPGTIPREFNTPVFDCNCPAYSDVQLAGYDDYPWGLDNRDTVDSGNNPYLEDPTDLELRNRYAGRNVVHFVGERDTCLYNTGESCPAELENCQICLDPCAVEFCNDGCNGAPPSCKLAIQGKDHIETVFVYRDYVVDFYGAEILAKHRFELVPCIGHSTCCSWQSPKGKKHLFDVQTLVDGFDWNPGALDNGWLDALDNVNGNLENLAGELVPTTANLNLAGAYRPVPFGEGLRIRARILETDGPELAGGRFEHFFMLYSHGVRTSGYGVGVERTGATASDSRITLYENGVAVATTLSDFQFESEVELEPAVYADGRVEGSATEGGDELLFAFPERPIASSGGSFLYHTAWAAPGSTMPPRLDFLTIHEIPRSSDTPPGGSHTMRVDKLDAAGSALSIEWDTSCPGADGYHLVYGGGSQLPSPATGGFALTGGECGLSTGSPFVWSASPSPSTDPTGLVWWLVLANDGATTEGSWGLDSAGDERRGPGEGGVSGQCGMVARDTSNPCGR